jgi:pimeloyl-ACP methyl ester carboxylesterase
MHAQVIDGYLKPMKADNWDRAYLLMLRAFSLPSPPSWASMHQPVLVVQGDQDTSVRTPQVKRLLDKIRREQPSSEYNSVQA